MSRKKNLFEYIFMALMIMCLGLALSASLEYVTRATEREYLGQGWWVLNMAVLVLLLYFGVRLCHKVSLHTPEKIKTLLFAAASLVVFCAGFLARLWVIHAIPIEPDSDFETYYRIATHLVNGTLLTPEAAADREYIALYPHVIGYPMLVLQPVFSVFGISVNNALYANLACSMLAVLAAAHIGYRLHGRLGSFSVLALMSLWPSHIFYSNMVATEPAFTLLILLAADIMISVLDRRETSLYARSTIRLLALDGLLGVMLAVAGAIRPMALILLAAFAAAQLSLGREGDELRQVPGTRRPITTTILCFGIALVLYLGTGSIITRVISDTIMEQPVGGLSASGYNLMVGVNPEHLGVWNQEDADFFFQMYDETGSADLAHKACMDKALERISAAPEDTLNLLVYKFRDLWQTDDFGIDWNLLWTGQQGTLTDSLHSFLESVRPIGRTMYMLLLLLVTIGVLDTWRKTRAPHPFMMVCILFFLGTALAHMLLETQVRYHYNMIPFLILLSSWTFAGWRERIQEEPPVKLVDVVHEAQESYVDHTNFDMSEAIRNGNIHISVTKKYADDAGVDPAQPPVSPTPPTDESSEPPAESEEAPADETTVEPTEPSAEPEEAPADEPTVEPTEPSTEPEEAPADKPTEEPTEPPAEPEETPADEPTVEPTEPPAEPEEASADEPTEEPSQPPAEPEEAVEAMTGAAVVPVTIPESSEDAPGGNENVPEESDAGLWHETGSHQNVPAGQRTENPLHHSNSGVRHRAAPANAGSGAGNLPRSARLRPVHHAGAANPVRRNLQHSAAHPTGAGKGAAGHRSGARRHKHNLRNGAGVLLPAHSRRSRGSRSAYVRPGKSLSRGVQPAGRGHYQPLELRSNRAVQAKSSARRQVRKHHSHHRQYRH